MIDAWWLIGTGVLGMAVGFILCSLLSMAREQDRVSSLAHSYALEIQELNSLILGLRKANKLMESGIQKMVEDDIERAEERHEFD